MGATARKKKEKAADFSKAKLKLGKGKQVASNATDTSFKARSIALPRQSVAEEKNEDAPTTRRNLSLQDLLLHLKHYSAGIRKDALGGLKEILSANPDMIESSLSTLINACVRLISDEDALVRKTLISFLSWLLPLVPRTSLAPHTSLLLLFTTSALSHIYPEIRVDAVRFLDIYLSLFPSAVVSGWASAQNSSEEPGGRNGHGKRVLNGYLTMFDMKGKAGEKAPVGSSSSLTLSANSKLTVLKSLCTFLRASVSHPSSSAAFDEKETAHPSLPTWYFAPSFATPSAYTSFAEDLQPKRSSSSVAGSKSATRMWQETIDADNGIHGSEDFMGVDGFSSFADGAGADEWDLSDLTDAVESFVGRSAARDGNAESEAGLEAMADLALRLHSVLTAVFLDAAPSVFNPSGASSSSGAPANVNVELIHAAGQIAGILYGAICPRIEVLLDETRADVIGNLRLFVGYLSPYFPFDAEGIWRRDLKSEVLLQDLSLIYCELASLLTLPALSSLPASSLSGSNANGNVKREKVLAAQIAEVGSYVVRALKGQLVTASQPLGRQLSAAAYTALVPTIWSLISQSQSSKPKGKSNGNSDAMQVDGEGNEGDGEDVARQVLDATLEHAIKTGSMNAVKRYSVEFVARLWLVHTDALYCGQFNVAQLGSTGFERKFVEWALSLPRMLWEVGVKDEGMTEVVLLFVLRVAERGPSFMSAEDVHVFRQRMVPFIAADHPTRGVIPGPFAQLSGRMRRLVLDAVLSLSMRDEREGGGGRGEEVTDELTGAVDRGVLGTDEEGYWVRNCLVWKGGGY